MIPAFSNANPTPHQDAIREAMLRLCRAEGHKAGVPNKMGVGVALVTPKRARDRRAEILAVINGRTTVHQITDATGINASTASHILEDLCEEGILTREKVRRGKTTFWIYQRA